MSTAQPRAWTKIIIDAGLRQISAISLADEIGAPYSTVWAALYRYGVQLPSARGGARRTPKPMPLTIPAQPTPEEYWSGLLAESAQLGESTNAFCLRTGHCYAAAEAWAERLGHHFSNRTAAQRRAARWDREIDHAKASGETLNAFCVRTGRCAAAAEAHAKAKGHTFPSTKHQAKRRAQA